MHTIFHWQIQVKVISEKEMYFLKYFHETRLHCVMLKSYSYLKIILMAFLNKVNSIKFLSWFRKRKKDELSDQNLWLQQTCFLIWLPQYITGFEPHFFRLSYLNSSFYTKNALGILVFEAFTCLQLFEVLFWGGVLQRRTWFFGLMPQRRKQNHPK